MMKPNDASHFGSECSDGVGPKVWVRKDQIQQAITRGGLMCAMYPNTNQRADLQPLYDQAALDAAVAEANRRQNAAWALMAEKLVAAERERWALWARAMHRADDAYGAGFYQQDEWIAAYEELRRMAGMGERA